MKKNKLATLYVYEKKNVNTCFTTKVTIICLFNEYSQCFISYQPPGQKAINELRILFDHSIIQIVFQIFNL